MSLKDEEILKLLDPKISEKERAKIIEKQIRLDSRENFKMTFLIAIPFIIIFLFYLLLFAAV